MQTHSPTDIETLDPETLLGVLSLVKAGDFTARMPVHWTGTAGKIADGLNEIIGANQALGAELARVSRVVGKEGKLSQRVSFKGTDQVWGDCIESVNDLIEDLVRPSNEMQRVIGAMADGDLSKKVSADVHGEMLELKNTINGMVDQLNGFVSEVTRVAREVGTEGKLGQAAAHTVEVGGVWKELTDNVNLMAGNLTGQVRDWSSPALMDTSLSTETGEVQCSAEPIGCRRDGSTFPMELDLSDVQLGTRAIHIGCIRDVSDRKAHTEALEHQALHDGLTGLPNRVLFGDRVDHAIRAALRTRDPLALLVMDLNEFKQVNDTLGHQLGDALLQLVTDRLVACLRNGDTVARLGGDEFGILPLASTDLAGAATIAWKIEHALEPPFLVAGHSIDVRASIGIALAPEHGENLDDLLRRADLAMYDAKRSGGGYAVFAAEQEEAPARRLALLSDLRTCVERDELVLHYQPKIDLVTRETIGVEALIRWNHPSGRLMTPNEFMPEVENNELMIPITEWVIGEALKRLRTWRDSGYDLTMAVNLGARCLAPGTGLFEKIDELTDRWEIPPDRLTLELTESALIDTAIPGLLERLEHMDERLSIDDFGTGYSSLLYLQRLPVVEIKADRSFVSTLSTVPDDAVIVRSTIDLAHNLSLKVVAEGVEDETTMDLLIEYGCDEAQGYFFSRPLPGDELTQWLESSPFGSQPRLESSSTHALRAAMA